PLIPFTFSDRRFSMMGKAWYTATISPDANAFYCYTKVILQAGVKPWKNWFHSRSVSPDFPIFSLYCINEHEKRVQGRYCPAVEARPGDRKAYRLCGKQNRAC